MKNNKVNYIVVGTFVLIMLVGLMVFVAKLSAWSGVTDKYFAIYKNVTGVKFGSQVMYEGYAIGQVEGVTPIQSDSGMRFKVDFSVQKDWRIPDDSVSEIAKPGLLSAITLSIRAGTSPTAYKPGVEIKGKEAADLFAVVSSVAGQVTDLTEHSLKPLLETVRKTTETFGNLMEGEAGTLMATLNTMVQDISKRVPIIADNIEKFTVNMNRSSKELNAVFSPKNRKIINKTMKDMAIVTANFTTTTANFDKLLGDLDTSRKKLDVLLANMVSTTGDVNSLVNDNKANIQKSLRDLRHIVGSVARHVDSVNQNMEGAARNMYEFSRQIRQNPGLLLGGSPPKDDAPGK